MPRWRRISQLGLDGGEVDRLAPQRVVVAAHAAHAALGVAGVGQVERREGLERPRPARARRGGGGMQRLARRAASAPQHRHVVDGERLRRARSRQDAASRTAALACAPAAEPGAHVIGVEREGATEVWLARMSAGQRPSASRSAGLRARRGDGAPGAALDIAPCGDERLATEARAPKTLVELADRPGYGSVP